MPLKSAHQTRHRFFDSAHVEANSLNFVAEKMLAFFYQFKNMAVLLSPPLPIVAEFFVPHHPAEAE